MSETGRSHVRCTATLWEPQEHEIRLVPHQESETSPFPFDGFWYLDLSGPIMIGLGRHPESVASDAAAMRKLEAVAAEVAEHLERRAASVSAGSGADG